MPTLPASLDPVLLEASKARLSDGDASMAPAVERLRRQAHAALTAGPFSITYATVPAPSGDPHDYRSFGSYWWPNPNSSDGLPYIRRDGVLNPEAHRGTREALETMCSAVHTLTMAHYFFGDVRYARRAAELIRVWFLDPDTAMNPHLRYAQGIPGQCEGRDCGLIDAIRLPSLLDCLPLLRAGGAWSAGDHEAMRRWVAQFCRWCVTSDLGQSESRQNNNHGTAYDYQVVRYALFINDQALARRVIESVGPRRIAVQVQPDGSMPAEMKRTRSHTYATLNAWLLLELAIAGRKVGIDLASFRSPDHRCLRGALDWFEPYVGRNRLWPGQQITPFEDERLAVVLRLAALTLRDDRYEQWISRLEPDVVASALVQLTHPYAPQSRIASPHATAASGL